MYSVSNKEKYMAQITAPDRTFYVRITFNSSTVLTGTTVQDVTLDEVVNSADILTMGCACSNKITVNLIDAPTDIDYQNSSFTAEIGVSQTISGFASTSTKFLSMASSYLTIR
mgnify:CR=1 FL=1